MIKYLGPLSPVLKVYPNPSNGKTVTLEIKGIQDIHTVPVNLYNQQGLKIMEILVDEDGPGVFQKEVIFNSQLPAGLYILKAGRTLQLMTRLVIN